VGDETDRLTAVPAAWTDAMRRLSDLATRMTEASQAVAVAGAKATPPALAQPLARYADQMLAFSAAFTTPLRRLLDDQERLVDLMAAWAEQHRQLSDQIADWADQQRRLSEQMVEFARPLLEQSAMLESLQAEWSGRSAGTEPRPREATTPAKKSPAKKAPASRSARKTTTRSR
jgi:hypothetical protein